MNVLCTFTSAEHSFNGEFVVPAFLWVFSSRRPLLVKVKRSFRQIG